jgi:signal transduction histidine kinase
MSPNARFMSTTSSHGPPVLLVSGVLLNLLLIGLFSTMEHEKRAYRATARLSEHLVARTIELEANNQELERFACLVSHDLKSPLRGIESLAHWIAEDLALDAEGVEANAQAKFHLERMHKRIKHMRSLIDDILDYSSLEANRVVMESVNLKSMIADILETNGFDWEAVTLDITSPSIVTSRVQLSQVIGNLVNNAFKHHPTPQSARVSFSAVLDGDYCIMRVSDDGAGIDPDDHERVFDFLDSLGSSHEDSTGIGLAIVKRIVERAGGHIRIESARDEGCCFVIRWPVSNSLPETLPLAA